MILARVLLLAAFAPLIVSASETDATCRFFRRTAGTCWQDGLFAGNGQTGVIGYAPSHFEWIINRHDVFDRRVAPCRYTPHAQVMARVATNRWKNVAFLEPERARPFEGTAGHSSSVSAAILRARFWDGVGWSAPAVPLTEQSLDLDEGELYAYMTSAGYAADALTIVPRDSDVFALRVSSRSRVFRAIRLELTRPEDPRLDCGPDFQVDGDIVSFVQRLPYGDSYAVAIHAGGAAVEVRGRTLYVRTRDAVDVVLAVRASRACDDPRAAATAAVREASARGFDALRSANAQGWRRFWNDGARAEWTSEPEIGLLWKHALYALGAQFSASPMPALNGLSYGPLDGAFAGVGSNLYVQDQNVQIPMMPFFPLDRCRYVRTFVSSYTDVLPELKRRTREAFGVEGVYLPANMNADGVEIPTGHYRYTLCASAYSGLILAQAWRYSRDPSILKDVYPLLKEFVRFYLETASKDSSGVYHFLPSVPPEIFTLTRDELSIVACLKPCLETLIEAAERFGGDAAEVARWKDVLANYPAMARHVDGGWWCGPEIPQDHYMYGGHLFYPFFPAESDTDPAVAERTLVYARMKGVETRWTLPTPHQGHEWSAFYSGVARMRLNDPADGWRVVNEFKDMFAKPNGFFSHNPVIVTNVTAESVAACIAKVPPNLLRSYDGVIRDFGRGEPADLTRNPDAKRLACPVLEAGAAFLFLSTEALLQSTEDEIRLFPSVPPGFTGSIDGFLAKGGRRVTARMVNGRVADFSITGGGRPGGAPVRVVCPVDPSFRIPGAE